MKLYKTTDVETTRALHKLCLPNDDWEDATAYWLLQDDVEPKGFCSVRKLTEENAVFLVRAGILPSARGAGLQRGMIRARVQWARSLGCESVITYATFSNHASVVNLLRCGFQFYTPEYDWGGPGNHYFLKEL